MSDTAMSDDAAPQLLSKEDREALRLAMLSLEQRGLTDHLLGLTSKLTQPGLTMLSKLSPKAAHGLVERMVQTALRKAFDVVLVSVAKHGSRLTGLGWLDRGLSSSWVDSAASVASGAVGGFGGLASTAVELPITTAFLMRSVAQIAVKAGEDLQTDEAKLQCLQVFALGGTPTSAFSTESEYYGARLALSGYLPKLADKSLKEVLPKLIVDVSRKFSVDVAAKISSQAVPFIGAATGASLNLMFMRYYNEKARAHFAIRRLERAYGVEPVRSEYERLVAQWKLGGQPHDGARVAAA